MSANLIKVSGFIMILVTALAVGCSDDVPVESQQALAAFEGSGGNYQVRPGKEKTISNLADQPIENLLQDTPPNDSSENLYLLDLDPANSAEALTSKSGPQEASAEAPTDPNKALAKLVPPAPGVWQHVDQDFLDEVEEGLIDLSDCKANNYDFVGCSAAANRMARKSKRLQNFCLRRSQIAYRLSHLEGNRRIAELQRRLREEIATNSKKFDRLSNRLEMKIERIKDRLSKRIEKIEKKSQKVAASQENLHLKLALRGCVPPAMEGNHLVNGDFEADALQRSWDILSSDEISGWSLAWNDPEACDNNLEARLEIQSSMLLRFPAYSGEYYAELDSDCRGPGKRSTTVTISQKIQTVPGHTYEVSFAYRARPSLGKGNQALEVTFAGEVAFSKENLDQKGEWEFANLLLESSTWETEVTFADIGEGNTYGTLLDSIEIHDVTD